MNKIMEYMFFGLPVVAYDLTEARVSAGDAAVFVEPNRERALADGIVELLDDSDRRRVMGAAGRERVRTALAWEHSAPVLLAAYDRLWPALAGDQRMGQPTGRTPSQSIRSQDLPPARSSLLRQFLTGIPGRCGLSGGTW
jgi:hypothetical protein